MLFSDNVTREFIKREIKKMIEKSSFDNKTIIKSNNNEEIIRLLVNDIYHCNQFGCVVTILKFLHPNKKIRQIAKNCHVLLKQHNYNINNNVQLYDKLKYVNKYTTNKKDKQIIELIINKLDKQGFNLSY